MEYQFALEILTEDGRVIERAAVTPDWKAALAWVHFEGVREGRLAAESRAVAGAIEPVWDDAAGEPFVARFRVVVPSQGKGEVSREIPRSYLHTHAKQATETLVERGALEAGATVRYVVSAFPAGPAAAVDDGDATGFVVEDVARPLALADASLARFASAATFAGSDPSEGHIPVFLPRRVLEETLELSRAAGDFETGGVLVGRLRRDAALPEVFVEVTAQIAAPHTRSHATKLTFTGETWAAVQAALDLRRQGEIMLGWWHFHPDFCRLRQCPIERRKLCPGASPFFSTEDIALHATCFPAGFHVALLISDSTADGIAWSLFGWSQGMVVARGFHVLEEKGGDADATHATPGF